MTDAFPPPAARPKRRSQNRCVDVSLVLPCYNSADIITKSLSTLTDLVRHDHREWELVVVCDGCVDETARLANKFRDQSNVRCSVISYSKNRGKGYAVRAGLASARGSFRVFTDIDLAYSFESIVRVVENLEAGAAVAIASRAHPNSSVTIPQSCLIYAAWRTLESGVFQRISRAILGLKQQDTQAGLKGFSARWIVPALRWLQCDGFGFDCEILSLCDITKTSVTEVPIAVTMDTASSTNWLTPIRMLRELVAIRGRRRDFERAFTELSPRHLSDSVPSTPVLRAA